MNNIKKKAFILLFLLLLLYPIVGRFTDKKIELSGVTAEEEVSKGTVKEYLEGTAQSKLNSWIENNFWGRKGLIKLRSQMLYSLFDVSPNANVILGKDKYLFEANYIYEELNINETVDDEHYDELIEKLEKINDLCKQSGKELFVFITPSKAHFFKDKIPDKYVYMGHDYEGNYNRFMRHISDSDIRYFDAHEYIEQHRDEIDAPVFYSTGIHWSHPWAEKCTLEFCDYISENSNITFGEVNQTIEKSKDNEPIFPDADLYNSLNLVLKPQNDTYYSSEDEIEDLDKPNVFVRGGSFMGQSLASLGRQGLYNMVAYIENYYYYTDNFSNFTILSDYTAYDEFSNMKDYLKGSDLLILEVNEAVVYDMSFGFMDYLLEHPELFAE